MLRSSPGWYRILTAVGLLLVLVGAAAVEANTRIAAQSSLTVDKGPSPNPSGPSGGVGPAVPLPSPQPSTCGYWTATYAEIAKRYGDIRDCMAVDDARSQWLITTLGSPSTHGVIAIYVCANVACRDGRIDHPIGGWAIYPAPYPGGVT